MRALVVGAKGTLGQELATLLPNLGWQTVAVGREGCDIEDAGSVAQALDAHKPHVVFNAAGFTNVDRAEDDEASAYRANALAPEILAHACRTRGAKLVHYSTDYVFDGTLERPYDEFDPVSPQGLYARSKVAGERLAAAASASVFVVRVGCLYGDGGRNFPSTVLRRLLAGETIRADRDRLGSPTWVRDVARVSAALARTDHFGLYHCTSAGETSWVGFAQLVAQELGLPESRVEAMPTAALAMKAPRPRRAILDNRMLRLRGVDTMPTWQAAARAYIASHNKAA